MNEEMLPDENPTVPEPPTDSEAVAASEEMVAEGAPAAALAPSTKNWFIVHTYSGFEQKVSDSLRSRAEAFGFSDKIGQILIPTEEVVELRNGKKITSKRMLYRATFWWKWK